MCLPLNCILQGRVVSQSDFRTFKPKVLVPDVLSYSKVAWNIPKMNALVQRQNALLTAGVALEGIMSTVSFGAESYSIRTAFM